MLDIIGKQSPDIAQGVDRKDERKQGAGDQGLMFGYASNETEVLMPPPITLAHRLVEAPGAGAQERQAALAAPRRQEPGHDALRRRPSRWASRPWCSPPSMRTTSAPSNLREAVIEEIIKPVLPAKWIDKRTKYHINPTGRFVIGGPDGDCGLTGRKIIVDTYGGFARHGGGAFSGKDPSKVDRSAAYAARYVAKNIVAAGLASAARCRCPMPSAWPSRPRSWSRPSAPASSPMRA